MNWRRTACVAVGAAALAGTAQATITLMDGQSVPFSAWINDPQQELLVFDKVFKYESYTSAHFPAADISIGGVVRPSSVPGKIWDVGFDMFFGFGDTTPGDASFTEFNLQYTVTLLPTYVAQGWRITDNKLIFNGNSTGPGSFARVDESVLDANNTLIGQKSVFDIAGPPRQTRLEDQIIWGLPGYTFLEVNKDAKFFAAGPNDTATASFIRQTFSQVPTPGALTLLGAAGLLLIRRRSR